MFDVISNISKGSATLQLLRQPSTAQFHCLVLGSHITTVLINIKTNTCTTELISSTVTLKFIYLRNVK